MTTDAVSNLSPSTPETTQPKIPDKLGADKATFLKLLVAQLKYQNPLNPADGVQFVTQLAQFTALEQSTNMSQDLAAIRKVLEAPASSTTTA